LVSAGRHHRRIAARIDSFTSALRVQARENMSACLSRQLSSDNPKKPGLSKKPGFWLCLAVSLAVTASAPAAPPQLRAPPGFVVEQVAGEPDTVYPMFGCFDDRGRLFVAESSGLDLYKEISALTRKCRIRLLEDPDEKGRFRKSTVWADNLVFPMGLAGRDGKLYVADPPDLMRPA